EEGAEYKASMTFINDGNEDVVLRGFRLHLRAPEHDNEDFESQELPWEVPSFVLRAGEEVTYSYENEVKWRAGFIRCSRPEPRLGKAMARATLHLSFDASTLE